ncbi:MAG: hypothetical protein J6Q82_01925 [Clostridia bacterium]|nr:hypothetical protein [Clostridia bacterium]
MAEIFEKHGRASVLGTEVLRWRISLPLRGDNVALFYEEIGRRAVSYCEGALTELATEEFERSDDPNKRFCFPVFSYRLEGRVTYEDDRFLSVCLAAELRRRGDRSPLVRFEDGQVWERTDGMLLPPEEVVRLVCKTKLSRKEKRKLQGILLSEKDVLWYDGVRWNKKEASKE